MTPELAADLFKNVIIFSLYVVSPFLVITLLVGLVTSLLQSITSIQEQTLTFAPKIIIVAGVTIALGPWLLRTLSEYATQIITQMGTLGQ
jgi:flagellar biosynthesis protein FliQ